MYIIATDHSSGEERGTFLVIGLSSNNTFFIVFDPESKASLKSDASSIEINVSGWWANVFSTKIA